MVTVVAGALLGWAFSGALIGWGIVTTAFGAIMLGASLGSLFMSRDAGDFSSSPTYSFGPISNTMSQLVPIPVIYGRCRVAGNIIYQAFADDKKEVQDLYILVGEGPVTAINSVLCNDQDPAALEDCSLTTYLNTAAATHDSRDPSGARPYPDDVALICLTLKAQEKLNGTPTVTSIVDGVKVWTPAGFAWSRNPVWIILDILCHPRYGLGYGTVTNGVYQHPDWDKIDYACAVAAAAYCDGTVSYGARFMLDFTLDTQRPIRDVLADFLASCRGYMVETDKLQICIDAPVSIYSREITPDNIVEGSFTFWQAADEDVCNRITIDWIDPNNSYERVTDVFQDSADIADRGVVEKSISLLPVTRSGQVGHMGYYLLKTSLMVRNFCSFGVGLKDCDIQPGEVLKITFQDFTGWYQKPFRVVSVKDGGQDVITVTCSEYIADVYDDSVLDITHHIDTSLNTNYKPDDVTDMAIAEQLETLQDGSYNLIAKITWTPPASYSSLELWYRYSSEVSWKPAGTLPRGSEEYYLPCTEKIGDTLYVKIYVVSRLGVRSDGQTTSKILRGDLTPPAAPTGVGATGKYRCAEITWIDPADGDLDHIDVYRSLDGPDSGFEKIGVAQRFAQTYTDSNLYVMETAWYKLKAVDVAKNESEFSAVVSGTSTALKMEDIPEQSITPSKLLPQLAKLEDIVRSLAEAGITNSINEDENRTAAAIATQNLNTKVDEGFSAEATARTELGAQLNGSVAALQQLMQVVARAVKITDGTSPPLSPQEGDIWKNEDIYRQWNGAVWAQITNADVENTLEAVIAQYTLTLDVNGSVAGFGITNSNIGGSEFAVLAGNFKVASPGGDKTVIFEINTETGLAQLRGDLIVDGSITGAKINAAAQIQLGAGGKFIAGDGAIFQMGNGAVIIDSDAGVLQIKDPNNLATGDYIRMETGNLTSYKYINGAYRPMKSLRKVHYGQNIPNNTVVTLPGYWPSAPNIIVSPSALQSYSALRSDGNQTLNLLAADISWNAVTGIATFRPVATLVIAAGNVNIGASNANFVYTSNGGGNVSGSSLNNSVALQSISVQIGFYGQLCEYLSQSSTGHMARYRYGNITYSLYISINGTRYFVGSGTVINGRALINSDPVTLYQVKSNTLTVNIPAGATIYAYATYYVSALNEPATNEGWETPKTESDYSRCWVKLMTATGVTVQTQQLAEGSLNYMAIAE